MGNRVAVAVPGIALAIAVVYVGGPLFVVAAAAIAVLGVYEYLNLVAELAPLRWAAVAGAAVTAILPSLIDPAERAVVIGVAIAVVLGAVAGLILKHREEVTLRVGVSVFGAVYLGVPLGLFVATRELPHGAAAVANVLVGTWAFDTFSYVAGKTWGTHPIAPKTSPNKTVEGFAGGVIGGTLAVWIAGLYMDWIGHLESLALGVILCGFAYLGDLFESMMKRDIDIKDSGRLLGAHGGVLDRFDAMLFTAAAGYFATVLIV